MSQDANVPQREPMLSVNAAKLVAHVTARRRSLDRVGGGGDRQCMRTSIFACVVALAACGGTPLTPNNNNNNNGSGLQYDGSITSALSTSRDPVGLSAPLFPDAIVFQRFQDPKVYPTTSATERERLIDDDVRSYEQLLLLCAGDYPQIKLRNPGDPPLTTDELRTNYDAVARCAYAKYGAKPYWVPEHVDDVDPCARKLKGGWHLPTEADIAALGDADFKLFADTLTAVPGPGKDWFPVEYYYRLEIYARGGDGTLRIANLAPGVPHIGPLPVSGDARNALYLGNGRPISVRCMRSIPPASSGQ